MIAVSDHMSSASIQFKSEPTKEVIEVCEVHNGLHPRRSMPD